MGIRRLNHAVLYVRDVERSAAFYRDVLGFREVVRRPVAVFLRAADSDNDHDLGLTDLADYQRRLREAGALVGASDHVTTKALYAKDPDGLEFEVSWLVPADRVTDEMRALVATRPLDLDAEIEHWGPELVGMS
jgi:catechol-2,3-dioxygenase